MKKLLSRLLDMTPYGRQKNAEIRTLTKRLAFSEMLTRSAESKATAYLRQYYAVQGEHCVSGLSPALERPEHIPCYFADMADDEFLKHPPPML